MNLSQLEKFVNVPVDTTGAFVVAGICAKCKKPVENEWALALPGPYHCLLHMDCFHFFNYNHSWPHDMPAQAYYRRRRNSSPGMLEQSQ